MKNFVSYNKFIRNVIFLSVIYIIVLFLFYGKFIQSTSIEKSIKDDSNMIGELVFNNLYTVMRMGGDKKLLDETITRIEEKIPNINISIVKENISNREIIKTTEITKKENSIQFSMPILFKQECLGCHTKAKNDDLAGVMYIEHAILDIKLSLKEILMMIFILFILVILVFFSTWIYFLRKHIIMPINKLIKQISTHKTYKDLKTPIFIDTKIKEIKLLEKAFNKKNVALYESSSKLEESSNMDILTGIYNRKKFDEYSILILGDSKRYNHTFSLVVIDLNKFKIINDTYGHAMGDKVLIFFSQLIHKSIRETDYLFRMGGDEFYLLLTNTSANNADVIIKKLRNKLSNEKFIYENIEIELSSSFGTAEYGLDGLTIDELIVIADFRMYENKKSLHNIKE